MSKAWIWEVTAAGYEDATIDDVDEANAADAAAVEPANTLMIVLKLICVDASIVVEDAEATDDT